MTEDVRQPAESTQPGPAKERLDSWKAIGAYLKRDVTTVRRWEKREGLPVHRHPHDRRDSVYAYRDEIDRWWDERRNGLADKATAAPQGPIDGHRRERLAWVAAGLLAVTAGVLAFLLYRGPTDVDERVVRLSLQPSEEVDEFALSPDGRLLAFIGAADGKTRIWLRALDSASAQPLAGTEGADGLFWSPDSRFVAFGADGKLKKVAISGGAVHSLCDTRIVIGGTWSREDVIVFAPNNRSPLYKVSASGGEPVQVTALDSSLGHNTHRWPYFLPDGRRFLFLARSTTPENSGIYVGTLDSPAATRVIGAEWKTAYAEPGHLLFVRDGALLAQPFDSTTLQVRGEPVQILADVFVRGDSSNAGFSVSQHGEMAYQTGDAVPRSPVVWFDRTGKVLESLTTLEDAQEPSLSPDGARVAVTRWIGPSKDIWVVDRTKGLSRITSSPAVDVMPIWSPDGDSLVFASNRDGPSDLYRMASNGAGEPELLLKTSEVKSPSDWSRAAGVIVYEVLDRESGYDIWTLSSDGTTRPFLRTSFNEAFGRLSPDGRWMAYVSNESGTDDVYVQRFPQANYKSKISTAGGTEPRWRGDGKELFYRAPDGKVMSVAVEIQPAFRASMPAELFSTAVHTNVEWNCDVARDGQRFVCAVPAGEPTPAPITVLLNWPAALSKR